MDKHNNEIYKNWYSTNINGKKTCRQLLLSLTPLPEMHDVCREYWSPCTSFFFYQPSHVLKLSFMCSTESFQNTCILVTSVVNYI